MTLSRRVVARALVVLAIATPSVAAMLAAAPPAFAGSTAITGPAAGSTISSGDSVTATARLGACGLTCSPQTFTFTVAGPNGYARSTTAQESILQDVTVPPVVVSTGNGTAVSNGSWTAVLRRGTTQVAIRSFSLAFPASQPQGFAATGSGSRQVGVTWEVGSEPDLLSYALSDEAGVVSTGIEPSQHCASSGACSFTVDYTDDRPGTHTYSLTAARPGASSTDPDLVSDPATATATLDASQHAQAPSTSTGSASNAAGSGGSAAAASPSSIPGQPGARAGGSSPPSRGPAPSVGLSGPPHRAAPSFSGFAARLGALPPLPTTEALRVAGAPPLPFGTFTPTLPYGSKTVTVGEPPAAGLSTVTRSVASLGDRAPLARRISVALLLLLVGAHVRRFVRTSPGG